MKIVKSTPISSFGGLNFVLKELLSLKIDQLLSHYLPSLPNQSTFSWKDILFSYWSIFFCGGDCAEDIGYNLKYIFKNNPLIKSPSPDRLLSRLKDLSEPTLHLKKNRSESINDISINSNLNRLNVSIIKRLKTLRKKNVVLDYDNTLIYTKKSDAKKSYKKEYGYSPAVGIIGNNIVYIENRNGNCAPHTMQDDTIDRMFEVLKSQGITVDSFRADSASYMFSTITTINKHVKLLYVKTRMNANISEAIRNITNWREINIDGKILQRGSIIFTPFLRTAKREKKTELLKEYRLIVTKEQRRDGQMNLFTGDACVYSPILTNDFDKTEDEIVEFYNRRGDREREFDILKNDFAWQKLPFSKLEQNTVYLIITAICRNIYNYLIHKFSHICKGLSPNFRLKKFIFRFICIPAKWIYTGRTYKLRYYGDIGFKV